MGGDPTDIPVPADYDGDGIYDLAVYQISDDSWSITYSNNLLECTESDWISFLSPMTCPSSEIQIKTWTKTGQCEGGITYSTSEEIICDYDAPACIYEYSEYGTCTSSGSKSRTVVSSSPVNCQGSPDLSTQCTYISPCTESDWISSISPTTCPSSEIQIKTWTKTGQCEGGVTPTTETISCVYDAPICTYTYSDYGECTQSGIRSRTTTSTILDNCQGSPNLTQQCYYIPPCTESDWNFSIDPIDCPTSGVQTKMWSQIGICEEGVQKNATTDITCNLQLATCQDFNYSEWGECLQSDIKTRSILGSSPLGCQGGVPVTSETCVYLYNVQDIEGEERNNDEREEVRSAIERSNDEREAEVLKLELAAQEGSIKKSKTIQLGGDDILGEGTTLGIFIVLAIIVITITIIIILLVIGSSKRK